MRLLLQRVKQASVTPGGSIGNGLCILAGIGPEDTVGAMATKCADLRIFNDEAGKMNLSLLDVGGSALVVSQFTLYADTRSGRRPSFTGAALPDKAEPLIRELVETLRSKGIHVETGVFGADMTVEIHNDGPVTIWLDSAAL